MNWRLAVLLIVAAAGIAGVALQGPIPQEEAYHGFADQRRILGIAHFWNVVSNLPFVVVGALGLRTVTRREAPGIVPDLRSAYVLFFVGVAFLGLGSSYYHLEPNSRTLVWDRLPMTVVFMAFFAIVIGEHLSVRVARRLLVPFVIAGIGSVAWWAVSERAGHSDLRAYALVQFLPMVLIPLILVLHRSRMTRPGLLWLVLACNAAAKVLEAFDLPIHRALGFTSGHTLKHLAAAAATLVFAVAVRVRSRRS